MGSAWSNGTVRAQKMLSWPDSAGAERIPLGRGGREIVRLLLFCIYLAKEGVRRKKRTKGIEVVSNLREAA